MNVQPKTLSASDAMLDPVDVLAVQISHTSVSRLLPEVVLMAAVLADAIHSIQKHMDAKRGRARKEFLEACRWVFDPDHVWPFAFENVCDTLGLNAGAVRYVVGQLMTRPNPTQSRNEAEWRMGDAIAN